MVRTNYFRETDFTYRNHPHEYLEILDLMRQKFESVEELCRQAFQNQNRTLLLATLQPLVGYPLAPANYMIGGLCREIRSVAVPDPHTWACWQEEVMPLLEDVRKETTQKLAQSGQTW
ncbi:hypothetical protein SAMN05421823_107273 [Catalinimonas alkaloidigena]|uniref:Uncharacterized protein n=1 Tax=Catalinimonas alkaloidigena TaxID=1075417 RepID=A0A1G9M583_9BACT|nr:hypothetical protein [Catalinimonas alkaloidigena]SDL69429.1 hypothetical protein SAMN05421823_107273 [Catalinimonas alkaloidigena]